MLSCTDLFKIPQAQFLISLTNERLSNEMKITVITLHGRFRKHLTRFRSEKSEMYHWRIQDFPEVGRQPSGGCQHTILRNFPQNYMKLKEFGS